MTGNDDRLDAAGFHAALEAADTIAKCMQLFKDEILPLGFDTYACGEVDLNNRERFVFFAVDWPEEWKQFYLKSRVQERDPLLDGLKDRRAPFTWTELRADRKFAKAGSEILREAAQRGWTEGLVVPLARGGERFGLTSLAGRRVIPPGPLRNDLTLISTCFHARVRYLAPRTGFPIPPFGLTARELDCLNRVAAGRSDRGTGLDLGISATTAHEYVESGKRKLKARTRSEAVGIAMSFGLLCM